MQRLPTRPDDGPDAVLDRIAQGIQRLLGRAPSSVAGIGIGCPGHVDPAKGIVRDTANLRWAEVALLTGVRQRLASDLPIWIANDANVAALGEMHFGTGRGYRDFIYVGIGTGLGGAAVIDGELLLGANAYAMEIGHMTLVPNGRSCHCGLRGCTEMYISGVGLLAGVREHASGYPASLLAAKPECATSAILEAARAGDDLALVVIDEAVAWLSTVLTICATVLNPALIIIGGGLGRAAPEIFIHGMREQIGRRTLPATHHLIDVRESHLNNSALGPACLVWHELGRLKEQMT